MHCTQWEGSTLQVCWHRKIGTFLYRLVSSWQDNLLSIGGLLYTVSSVVNPEIMLISVKDRLNSDVSTQGSPHIPFFQSCLFLARYCIYGSKKKEDCKLQSSLDIQIYVHTCPTMNRQGDA